VQSGGLQVVDRGVASETSVANGGVVSVGSGGTVTGATIVAGGLVFLDVGAAGSAIEVDSGGALLVLPGTSVVETMSSGGAVISTGVAILNYPQYTLASSTQAPIPGLMISSSLVALVLPGGSLLSAAAVSGGEIDVYGDGTTLSTALTGGSEEYVAGGLTSGTTVSGYYSIEDVTAGGISTDAIVTGYGIIALDGGVASGAMVSMNGSLQVNAGGTAYAAMIGVGGSEIVKSGTTIGDMIGFVGSAVISAGGVASGSIVMSVGLLSIDSGGSATATQVQSGGTLLDGGKVTCAIISAGGSLKVASTETTTPTAANTTLLPGSMLLLEDYLFSAGDTASLGPNNLLTVTLGGGSVYTQTLGGDYSQDQFTVTSAFVGYAGSNPVYSPEVLVQSTACYLHGTLIDTPDGEQPIETLTIGDLVSTADGPARPIRWIGRRSYDRQFVQGNPNVIPIRIARDAIADGVPHTDLLVSPLHAMFVGGVLIPAKLLVNGVTITEATDIDLIHYVHLELASHDILLANGAPSESFVDCDSRGMFQNEAEYAALYPNNPGPRWVFCAPRIEDGHRLEDIRTEISARGGGSGAGANGAGVHCTGALEGYLDVVNGETVAGWAWQPDHPAEPVRLEIVVDGGVIAQVVANRERGDVRRAGYGTGRYGFELTLPKPLSPFSRHVVQARRVSDKTELGHSPRVLEPMPVLDIAARQALADAIQGHAAGASMEEREDLLGVLVAGTKRLLHARKGPSVVVDGSDVKSRTVKHRRRAQPALLERSGQFALVIDDRMPTPDKDAGSNAVLEHMRSLVRLGYRVGFVARDAAHNSKTAKTLERSGIACFGAPYFSCVEDVLRHHGGEAALVYVHRVANMALYGAMIRHLCPKARLVYSVADLHFLRQAREEAIRREPPARSRHLREQELAAARMADAVITHSSYETALLARVLPGLNVHTVPWPFEASGSAIPFSQRAGLAFIGSYDHRPNLDAATYLVKVVMPLVWRQAPSIDCLLVGSHMPETMRRLTSERVVAMGHVPDLDGLFDEIRLTVAPLRFGAGLKGKVLQSLAAGIPCVCTTIAAEGMDLPADLAGLVGQNAEELAALILRLHNNAGENARYGAAGIEFVDARHSRE
jgi:glycosyltransferase involved in cell wall biosynthesis